MAVHRYWRLHNRSGNATGQIGMGQIIMSETVGGAQAATGGTASASTSYGGSYAASQSFTGVSGDNWFGGGGEDYTPGGWIRYDFGAGNDVDIVEVRCSGAPGDYGAQMRLWDVESSDDGTTWAYEWTCYYEGWSSGAVYLDFPKPTVQPTNRWWAVLSTQTQNGDNSVILSELRFRQTPGGADELPAGGQYFPRNPPRPITYSYDNDLATILFSQSTNKGVIITYDFGLTNEKTVQELAITASPTQFTNCIQTGFILYSQNGRSYLRAIDFTAGTWSAAQTQLFQLAPPPSADLDSSGAKVFSILGGNGGDLEITSSRVFSVYNYSALQMDVSAARYIHLTEGDNPVEVSAARVFALVRGRVENRKLRAWTFSLDGHDFYVVRLGDSSTLVYDLATGQWARWANKDLLFWKAQCGTNWIGMGREFLSSGTESRAVGGDDVTGTVWSLDPLLGTDQSVYDVRPNLPFTRRVIGGVLMRLRETAKVGAVYLSLDAGNPAFSGAAITLRTSDDNGKQWTDQGTITATVDDNTQEFAWRSLGLIRAPGRIFELTDDGVTCRIDSLDMR